MGSSNAIIKTLCKSEVAWLGIIAQNHAQIRYEYELVSMDLLVASKADIKHTFRSQLEQIVLERADQAYVHDPW